jgi:hypothetical protein
MAVKKEEKEIEQQVSPMAMIINTPDEKMPQLTFMPTGGISSFASCKTFQQYGKRSSDGAFGNNRTSMEYYMDNIMAMNRSRNGRLLEGMLQMAQTEVEVKATETAEVDRYRVNG